MKSFSVAATTHLQTSPRHSGCSRGGPSIAGCLRTAIVDSDRFSTNVAENLADLFSLYRVLRVARDDRGALDFDSVEPKFSFDDKGKISSVVPHQRLEAHRLIGMSVGGKCRCRSLFEKV